jgi:hypothetical protein
VTVPVGVEFAKPEMLAASLSELPRDTTLLVGDVLIPGAAGVTVKHSSVDPSEPPG